MSKEKETVIHSIIMAQTELTKALLNLEDLAAMDQARVNAAIHALGNFLTITDGTCHLLLHALADYPDPQIRIWLDGLQRATQMMSNIVTNLRQPAPLDPLPAIRFEKVDLPLLIQRVCTYYQVRADLKNLRIIVESSVVSPFVRTDRVALAAVMDNLMSNAVKFSPEGRQITVNITQEGESLVCAVQDEGPGLSRADQAHLFQPGRRLNSAPTGGEASNGYGLWLAKRLLDQLQGEIWCDSEPGRGASFKFRLPLWHETA